MHPSFTSAALFSLTACALRVLQVRAVWKRHDGLLRALYKGFGALGSDLGGGDDDDDDRSIDLRELLLMFREGNLLDERCTARKVSIFFVQVNVDDEIKSEVNDAGGKKASAEDATGRDSAQCEYEEFLEILARVCNEKVPEPRSEPFHETLASWLSLFFFPAMRTVAKARNIVL